MLGKFCFLDSNDVCFYAVCEVFQFIMFVADAVDVGLQDDEFSAVGFAIWGLVV